MEPVDLAEETGARKVVFAENQPQYRPLPALVTPAGVVTTLWELSAEDLALLFCGGRIRLCVHTFGKPLQPVSLDCVPAECGSEATT